MERGCFIGIDQGSSATKAVVVGTDGSVLYQAKRELSPPFREGVRVEQDPEEILRSVRDVLNDTATWARDHAVKVQSAGLSCQRSSCLAWNESSREPLSKVLSWRDTRGAAVIDGLSKKKDRIFDLTGLPLTPYYSASKLRWILENVPSGRQKSAVFGPLSSFLAQRLTGSPQAVIDHTNAARTQLMDIGTLSWSPELLDLFGLGTIRLPVIVPTLGDFGRMATPLGQVPLSACIGDQQAALTGLGVTAEGEGGINYGTGAFLLVNTGPQLKRVPGLMSSVHYSDDGQRRYLLEGSVHAAGDSLEWLRTRFGLFGGHGDVDDLCWKASTDVVAFLAMSGTGAPHWESGMPGGICGLTAGSGPADVIRAAVEGIAFFIQDIEERMTGAGVIPKIFVASGGLSSLSYLIQAQADLFGKNVALSRSPEASAQGAAFLAGLAQGSWNAGDIPSLTEREEPTAPRTNPGLQRRRRRWTELHTILRGFEHI